MADPFEHVPDDVGVEILSFLAGVDVARAAPASRALAHFSQHPVVWAGALAREFPGASPLSGTLTVAPCDTPAAAAARLAKAYAHAFTASRCNRLSWVPSRVDISGPSGREGTAVASFAGGDVLVCVGGFCDRGTTIRGDVFTLDLNPVGRVLGEDTARALAAASTSPAFAQKPDPVSALRALLAARSPTRTGANVTGNLQWRPARMDSSVTPQLADDELAEAGGVKARPRPFFPRYGHAATSVVISDRAVWAAGGAIPAAAESSGGGSAPASQSAGGSTKAAPSFSRLRHSLLAAATSGRSADYVSPEHVATLGVAPEEYGSPPLSFSSHILVTGGMFMGGYRAETNCVYLLHGKTTFELADDEDYANVNEEEEDDDEDEEDDDDEDDDDDSDYDNSDDSDDGGDDDEEEVEASSESSAPSVGTPPEEARIPRVTRRMRFSWTHVKHPPASPQPGFPRSTTRRSITARAYHAATFVPSIGAEGSLFVSGGIARRRSIWGLEAIDLATWRVSKWGESAFEREEGGARAAAAAGGVDEMSPDDIATTGNAPCGRHGHVMLATSTGKLVVFAGATGARILRDGVELTDLHVLDLATRAWTSPKPSLLRGTPDPAIWTGRCLSATHVGGDRFITFGGYSERFDRPTQALAVLDLSTDEISLELLRASISVPGARYNHTAVRVGSRLHFYGGWAFGMPIREHLCLELTRGHEVCVDETSVGAAAEVGVGADDSSVDGAAGGGAEID